MEALHFERARSCVHDQIRAALPPLQTEAVDLLAAEGRVLAQPIRADRDLPPVARSIRDGYAVRAADLPGELLVAGEVRAGEAYTGTLEQGQAIEIMTGAPVPLGADAVVMIEHTESHDGRMRTSRQPHSGEFINPAGAECRAGDVLLPAGQLLDHAAIAVLATVGWAQVPVYTQPRVAILSTGDEVVPVEATPQPFQVRNSNAYSIAAQVARAGGIPQILGLAPDRYKETRSLIEQGLAADLLLLSGGVSAGKYDIVERVLADLGAEFFFDRVLIQPGQPLVFGRVRDRFFFGLPGNPASTMVTFRLFASLALELLGGVHEPALPFLQAPLTKPFRHKTGLTRFLPAWLDGNGALTPVPWQGSSDVAALAKANALLVADAQRESWQVGDFIRVCPK